MSGSLGRDALSGVTVSLPDLSSKPMPGHQRVMPEVSSPCPFCVMAGSLSDGAVSDGQLRRPVVSSGVSWVTVENRWPLLPAPAVSYLTVLRRHAEGGEELSPSELVELFATVADLSASVVPVVPVAFLSFGLQSASSQPHLHAQVVGHALFPARHPAPAVWACREADVPAGLRLPVPDFVSAHVPEVSEHPGEVRLSSGDPDALAVAAASVLEAVASTSRWACTLLMHPNPVSPASPLLRLLPRIPAPVAFEAVLAVRVRTIDPYVLAAGLRSVMS